MPVEKILPLWQGYLADVAAHRAKNLSFPPSQVLGDQSAFQNFVTTNALSLEQPARHD
jgi:hypothetical protein